MTKTNLPVSFRICSHEVRETPCEKCLHLSECLKKGFPASRLGYYIAWLDREALPCVSGDIYASFGVRVRLIAKAPYEKDEQRAYCLIKCYAGYYYRRLAFVAELKEPLTLALLRSRLYEAFADNLERINENENNQPATAE